MIKLILASVISLAVGLVFGKFVLVDRTVKSDSVDIDNLTQVRASGYKFISPLLECETNKDYFKLNGLSPLQVEVKELVESERAKGNITEGSVYFRDLNNGPWFGVNENFSFSPASLLKLPVMMAYYKKAETEPQLLKKKLIYKVDVLILDPIIESSSGIEKGKEYLVEDLIERMIIYSDNASLTLLEENIEPELIDKITLDLGIETATVATPEDYMSVRGYSGLFRILFNASYLNEKMSEKALDIMSKSKFDKGLVAGIPKGITVSHKFGERELSGNILQLHDCGIIYSPKSPYLLCIMTRGTNFENLERTIAKISATTYLGIETRKNEN